MRSNHLPELARLLAFAAVGVLNTALGYTTIVIALMLGCHDLLANGLGYAAGLMLGFVLNRRWTFSNRAALQPGVGLRYVAGFAMAYGANLIVLLGALQLGYAGNPLVHLAAIGVYSILFYFASSRFVFVERRQRLLSGNNPS